ncbi:MAG: hypothetical protein M3003_11705 [Candidatus Dormibacteraeota bacterium]|nr:hypothetical protein [Candidatus Dormibacteraeota bacterium]
MTKKVEIAGPDLALILEALDDAAFYRDARSRVLKSAVKRAGRRSPVSPTSPPMGDIVDAATDVHRQRSQAYTALATKLRRQT